MAMLLDGHRLTRQTRTERLLQAITFDAVIQCAPVASIGGVPLAIISAKNFTIAYASHLGVPREFVRADPTAAFAPFSIIAGLLLIGLLVLHEVDQLGLAEALKSFGRAARFYIFLFSTGVFAAWAVMGREDVGLIIASAILLYALLWWLPPFISLILRQILRILGIVEWAGSFIVWKMRKRRRAAGSHRRIHPLPPETLGKLVLATLVFAGVLTLPGLLGAWFAMTDSEFALIDRGKDHTEAILGVYGDRAFLGWVEGDEVVAVEMVAVSDLEGKPIWTAEIGPLRYEPLP